MELSFEGNKLSSQEIKDALKDLNLGEIEIQFSGEKNVLLRFKDVDEDTHQKIIKALESATLQKRDSKNPNVDDVKKKTEASKSKDERNKLENKIDKGLGKTDTAVSVDKKSSNDDTTNSDSSKESENKIESAQTNETLGKTKEGIKEKRFNSIGPVIGEELKRSAFYAIVIALGAIILYIGWAFRKVSYPISSFKYGIIATIALFHDVIITLGVFSLLGHFYHVEVGVPFIAAILAILGYSVNDTIVVFDRTRENLLKSGIDDFTEVVNKSVNETLIRSLNTSFTTLLVLFTLYLFGGETIRYFVVALLVGISAGTYSSIFIASPLLVTWQKWDIRRKS